MTIQPLLLTPPTILPNSGAAPAQRAAGGHDASQAKSSTAAAKNRDSQATKDTLEISPEAAAALDAADESEPPETGAANETAKLQQNLSPEEKQQVQELQKRDREVRAHEQAHLSAAGPYATGGPSFTYQSGPDGRQYAIGGEVPIDTSPIPDDPEATIQKARVIQAAALAPADPSSQDKQVAAQAAKMALQARQELREKEKTNSRSNPAEQLGAAQSFFSEAQTTSSLAESVESSDAIFSEQTSNQEDAKRLDISFSEAFSEYNRRGLLFDVDA